MNLHAIVGPAIAAINPMQYARVAISTGYTTAPDGTRVPSYSYTDNVEVQVQELTFTDLKQIEGLNIQGETKTIFLNGDWKGVVRGDKRGGDLVLLGDRVWLVVKVMENWPGWTKVAVTLQIDKAL